jgi:hypothetical protein
VSRMILEKIQDTYCRNSWACKTYFFHSSTRWRREASPHAALYLLQATVHAFRSAIWSAVKAKNSSPFCMRLRFSSSSISRWAIVGGGR